jgi:hypothetical protein
MGFNSGFKGLMNVEFERTGWKGRGQIWGLVFTWMDWGKTHGQFRQHGRCRGRDWNEAITEAKRVTYFFLTNLSGENVKCVFTRDEIAYTRNAKCRVKNTLHLKTHLDAVFRPYIRAISAHYCSQNTLEYSKALRGNCITMRGKIFWNRRVVGKPCVW